ncbi:MAG: O-antigen ligase family protein [Thermodesulfobacteriota bacterium]
MEMLAAKKDWIRLFPLQVVAVIMVAAVISLAAALGYVFDILIILLPVTVLCFYSPLAIPVSAIMLAPLLGRTGDSLIGPLSPISIMGLWFLLLGGTVVALNLKRVSRERFFFLPLALLSLAVLSLVVSPFKGKTAVELIRIFSVFVMLPLGYLLCGRERNRKIILCAILASSIIPLTVGLYQYVTGDVTHLAEFAVMAEQRDDLVRIYATFWDHHPFAIYLMVLCGVLFVFMVSERRSMYLKLAYSVLLGLSFFELISTYARSELIGFFISAAAALYASRKLKIGMILLVLPLLVGLFFVTGVFDRFADLFQALDLQSTFKENTLKTRILIWMTALPLALQRPVLGHGADTFSEAVGIVAHNDYLGLFYDLGAAGPLLYAGFLFLAAVKTFKYGRLTWLSPFDRCLVLITFGLTIAIIILSTVENLFASTTLWWLYLVLLGCVMRAAREGAPCKE